MDALTFAIWLFIGTLAGWIGLEFVHRTRESRQPSPPAINSCHRLRGVGVVIVTNGRPMSRYTDGVVIAQSLDRGALSWTVPEFWALRESVATYDDAIAESEPYARLARLSEVLGGTIPQETP